MGFWFILVCSCRSGAQYKFQVDYDSAQESYSLSLGSVERTMYDLGFTFIIGSHKKSPIFLLTLPKSKEQVIMFPFHNILLCIIFMFQPIFRVLKKVWPE